MSKTMTALYITTAQQSPNVTKMLCAPSILPITPLLALPTAHRSEGETYRNPFESTANLYKNELV